MKTRKKHRVKRGKKNDIDTELKELDAWYRRRKRGVERWMQMKKVEAWMDKNKRRTDDEIDELYIEYNDKNDKIDKEFIKRRNKIFDKYERRLLKNKEKTAS